MTVLCLFLFDEPYSLLLIIIGVIYEPALISPPVGGPEGRLQGKIEKQIPATS